MAKDGTNRGGRRIRAGDKPADLADKILNGKSARIINLPVFEGEDIEADDFTDDVTDIEGTDMPNPGDYLSASQKDGKTLGADEIFRETWLWLKERGCEKLVNNRLIESYSEAFARYIQCSKAVSTYGLVGKHPTTGSAIASPFVTMSLQYQKQANLLWYEIFDVVKQNCTVPYNSNPKDDMMEKLLRSKEV